MSEETNPNVKIAVLEERVKNLEKTLQSKFEALENELEKKANRSEIQPIRIIVFGFVGTILLAVITALVNLVLVSNGNDDSSLQSDVERSLPFVEGMNDGD